MTTSDSIRYSQFGFDNDRYLTIQKDAILSRTEKFNNGRMYLEIGGKLLNDAHASRTLPGFNPKTKIILFKDLSDHADMIYCINAEDIESNRQLKSVNEDYTVTTKTMIKQLEKEIGIKPKISLNLITTVTEIIQRFVDELRDLGYEVSFRYTISNYPEDTSLILSNEGYGKDDYIKVEKNLILVTGAASRSGKMSTCLGQIYQEAQKGLDSGYAKYETFPIWNLPLGHPINLAYEAATADIGDYNVLDTYHEQAYGETAVNYNRDVDAFKILMQLSNNFTKEDNYMRTYKSPTDMGINMAGGAISDDEIVCIASHREIIRRRDWFTKIVNRRQGKKEWVDRCNRLVHRSSKFILGKRYNLTKSI